MTRQCKYPSCEARTSRVVAAVADSPSCRAGRSRLRALLPMAVRAGILAVTVVVSALGCRAAAHDAGVDPSLRSDMPVDTVLSDTIGVRIFFHQSKVNVLPDYRRNAERLDSFLNELYRVQDDPELTFRHINIIGGASPEGTKRFNKWLSEQRASRITEYLYEHSSRPLEDETVTIEHPGVDWTGLKRMVLADSAVPDREQVLEIIDNPGPTDNRVARLKKLNYGIPWLYMYNKFYPPLRGSQVQIIYDRPVFRPLRSVEGTARFDNPLEPPTPELKVNPMPQLPFYAAVKTNLLYDAALIPNIGFDVYMGRNWSATVNWEYAWWKSDRAHWYWRVYGGDIEIRRWFGRAADEKPLTGHHIGPYFQLVTYDFELGNWGHQARRWTKAAGISYGYSLPIRERLNLEFEIGIGYAWGHFYKYRPIDDHYVWQETVRRRYVGPTKIEISLVWLLGHLNYNKRFSERDKAVQSQ